MIPKIIHYCWLSGEKMPETLRRCLESWKKYLPDYELRLWDASSLDYNSVPFTRDALASRKWAFVADYVRLYALSKFGGIYLDSDVQAFGPIDDMLGDRFFSGLEMRDKEHTDIYIEAAIMGAEAGHPFIERALELYSRRSFLKDDGSMDLTPIPTVLSGLMEEMYGWKREDSTQALEDGVKVYSTATIANSNCLRSKSVRLYHLNNRSWIPTTRKERLLRAAKRMVRRIIGR